MVSESNKILKQHFARANEFLDEAAVEIAAFLDHQLLGDGKKPYDVIPPYQKKSTLKDRDSFSDIGLMTLLKTYKYSFVEGVDDKRLQYIHKKILDARNYIKSHDRGIELDELFSHLVGVKLFVKHINPETGLVEKISGEQKKILDDMFGSEVKNLKEEIKKLEGKIENSEVARQEQESIIKNRHREVEELKNEITARDELLNSLKSEIKVTGDVGKKSSRRIILAIIFSFFLLICVIVISSVSLKKSFEKTVAPGSADKAIAQKMKQGEKEQPEEIIKLKYKESEKGD